MSDETNLIIPPPKGKLRMTPSQIEVTNWSPQTRNTLRGFFTIVLTNGLIIHGCSLHEKGDSRWIKLPPRQYMNASGETKFAPFLEFTSQVVANRFCEQTIAALDRYFKRMVIDDRQQQDQQQRAE